MILKKITKLTFSNNQCRFLHIPVSKTSLKSNNFLILYSPFYARAMSTGNTASFQQPASSTIESRAKEQAASILDMFPGDNPPKKALYLTLCTGMMSFLISNGLYIVNDETTIAVMTLSIFGFLYNQFGDLVIQQYKNAKDELESVLVKNYNEFLSNCKDQYSYNEKLMGYENYVKEFNAIRRKNVELEEEVSKLKQLHEITKTTKAKLDEIVKREAEAIAKEKRQKAFLLMETIMKELTKPQNQKIILSNNLKALENYAVAK